MTRPIYRWRLDELTSHRTYHTTDEGAELKVASELYRVWLVDGKTVRVDELLGDGKTWKLVEEYPAKQDS